MIVSLTDLRSPLVLMVEEYPLWSSPPGATVITPGLEILVPDNAMVLRVQTYTTVMIRI